MASPLKCDICDKPATVHLTQILNNQAHKVDLCEDCARAKGITDSSDFSLADLLIKASLNPEAPVDAGACEQCGFTQADFRTPPRKMKAVEELRPVPTEEMEVSTAQSKKAATAKDSPASKKKTRRKSRATTDERAAVAAP